MADDPRVKQLLDQLVESDATPEEVCVSCPELLEQVRERWREIRRAEAELDAMFPPPSPTDSETLSAEDVQLPSIDGYEVSSVLGVGGMGVVFGARHLRLNRVVALKMGLTGAYASRLERERFQREAEAVAALKHPNIVQIFDIGDSGGQPYFTMELIDSGSLAQKLGGTPLPTREAAKLVATLASAIAVAHREGIVHRDLKPANVLFSSDGIPKITDFGLARRVNSEQGITRSGAAIGTPSYMAPEQAEGKRDAAGPAVDIYALGAILYETITGRPPFRGASSTDTVHLLLTQDPVPPSRLNGKTPRDLETICLKCLQKDPERRYATCAALADDLDRFLNGETISARPEGVAARLIRRVRRRPVLAGAIALAVCSTIALGGGGLWFLSDRVATARAAEFDLLDMAQRLQDSSWSPAAAARDRAVMRLGGRGPAELRRLAEQGTSDLELAAVLDGIYVKGAETYAGGIPFATYDKEFTEAFRTAGLGTVGDDPETIAGRIRASNIRSALVAALDHYSVFMFPNEPAKCDWALEVARRADPDQSNWRLRARDQTVLDDTAARAELIATAPIDDPSVTSLLAFEKYLADSKTSLEDRLAALRKRQEAHPTDFWLNVRLGNLLLLYKRHGEALGYAQAAVALRPRSALGRYVLGATLVELDRLEEGVEQHRKATEIDPTTARFHQNFARGLSDLGRHDAAILHLRNAIQADPGSACLYTELGHCMGRQGKTVEAVGLLKKGIDLDPTRLDARNSLRNFYLREGRLEEARLTWQGALALRPPQHNEWYGYAELCLFLGKEDEYRQARKDLLARFGGSTDPNVAERTGRACLLASGTEEELRTAAALIERALAVNRSKYQSAYPYFLFARGLAEFRQGRLDRAVATLRGDASRVLGPAPRLVLAMALHQKGQHVEAREMLAATIKSHEWPRTFTGNQDSWMFQILRREAELMITADPSAKR